jgi:hypothetical protein
MTLSIAEQVITVTAVESNSLFHVLTGCLRFLFEVTALIQGQKSRLRSNKNYITYHRCSLERGFSVRRTF